MGPVNEMRELHYSELAAWMRCKRKWWNRHRERLVSTSTSEELTLGSLWHLLAPVCNLKGLLAACNLWDELTSQLVTDGEVMLRELLGHYNNWWPRQGITILEVETEHRWNIPQVDATVVCTPDALVEWKGNKWIYERKTSSKLETSHLFLDPQGLTYSMAVPDVMGVLYEFARKAHPNKTKLPLFELIPRRISREAKKVWGQDVASELSLLFANEKLEQMMSRNFNPINWMGCKCEYEDMCMAQLLGRDGLDMYRRLGDNEDRLREYPEYHDLVEA